MRISHSIGALTRAILDSLFGGGFFSVCSSADIAELLQERSDWEIEKDNHDVLRQPESRIGKNEEIIRIWGWWEWRSEV